LFLFTGMANAQQDECLEEVKQVYQEWMNAVSASKENTIYLKYNMEVVTGKNSGSTKNKSTVELISDQNNATFLTTDLKIYQDQKHTVSILHDKKIVVINEVLEEAYKKARIGQFELLKNDIFNELETTTCKMVEIGGNTYQKVVLKTTAKGRKAFNVATIQFLLDKKQNRIKEIQIKYIDEHHLSAMKITIVKQNLDYKSGHPNKEVLLSALTLDGKLSKKYTNYQLIDNRH